MRRWCQYMRILLILAFVIIGGTSPILSDDIQKFIDKAREQAVPKSPAEGAVHSSRTSADISDLAQYIKNNSKPLDWSTLLRGEERVIYLGEMHADRAAKMELSSHMQDVRAAGITHFGIEYGKDSLALVDKLLAGVPVAEDTILRIFGDGVILEMLGAAHKAGLGLVALDMTGEQKKETLRILCKKDPYCASRSEEYEEFIAARDFYMASSLARILDAPGTKVLVLVGAYHSQYQHQPKKFSQYGRGESKSYAFLYNYDTDNCNVKHAAEMDKSSIRYPLVKEFSDFCLALKESRLEDRRIFIPTPRSLASHDGYIVLPENLKQEGK